MISRRFQRLLHRLRRPVDHLEERLRGAVHLAPWVAVEVAGSLYSQESIGADDQASNRWDETGLVFLHVFVPAGTGTAVARQHCRALADTFRGLVLDEGALEFGDASIGMGAPGDDEGTTYRISVSVDWRRME